MLRNLVLPDGVRLATREEIPGPEAERERSWALVQAAAIAPGYVLQHASGERFKFYAEANVDAPAIWQVFRDLCLTLFKAEGALILSEIDAEPVELCSADVATLISKLEPHQYQLAHDGYLQFGIVSDGTEAIDEVFVAPTKHLKIWLNDEVLFRSLMDKHGLPEESELEFLDQFPRTTIVLPRESARDVDELAKSLMAETSE